MPSKKSKTPLKARLQSRLASRLQEARATPPPLTANPALRFSYLLVFAVLAVAAWLHLGTLIVTILFSLFTLERLNFFKHRWLAGALFLVIFAAFFIGLALFFRQATKDLPEIVAKVMPTLIGLAEKYNFNIPFSDLSELKEAAPKMLKENLSSITNFFKLATKEFIMLVGGLVISMGLFFRQKPDARPADNLYACYHAAISERFRALYRSFEIVMGAQILISAINTCFTSLFFIGCHFLGIGLPYPGLLIPLTFLCGLLPIVGNLMSNCFIIGVAFGVSLNMALAAFVFLVAIHKGEYFLNSKIIGSRIRQPMWLTLTGLILGEYLMGIPGVILAPVILNYIKVEASRFPAPEGGPEEDDETTETGAP